jgi:hypothetical protein
MGISLIGEGEASLKGKLTNLSVVKKSADQVSCDMAGEAVTLNLESGMYFGMDKVAARIWDLLEEPRTLKHIRDVILQEYQVDQESCERDLLAFLDQMESAGLIEIQNEPDV